ncbi:hypothetical protein U2F26_11800 [Micromonospora sp. 4G57]|uniref:DUF306 domain-containing protein n=1 Tax=Micromonospora sicca TaxID=2202420 RepID=A0ABU5J6F2_9ACTN|nr:MULTISPECIES: hypothetical protein [unclassified Micromonospora]MDZ5443411.1 hypothetical protein [Micromonospora sp. 4G57]MDZ5488089.1 hypothetical protein [Micromonospora sp. 4G53]
MTDPTTQIPPGQPAEHSAAPIQLVPPAETAHLAGAAEPDTVERRPVHALNGRTILLIAACAVAALLVAGTGLFLALSEKSPAPSPLVEKKSPFVLAKEKCGSTFGSDVELGDEGRTLTLHGDGKESSGLSFGKLECYWSELKMPDSVKEELLATRALDGRQSGDWDGVHASWSYHPDSGLQMVFTLAD